MQRNRRELLVLLEQKPRRVSEMAAACGMNIGAVYEALRDWKSLGLVYSVPTRRANAGRGRAQHVYGLAGADLSAFA